MKLRFQSDADVNPAIGRGLIRQAPEIDWRPAYPFIPDHTPDPDVLRLAAEDGRVLHVITRCGDDAQHFAGFVATQFSPGVIFIPPGTTTGDAIERLVIAWLSWSAEEIKNQIWWFRSKAGLAERQNAPGFIDYFCEEQDMEGSI